MSIRLTRVAPTPATLRPIWSSMPTIDPDRRRRGRGLHPAHLVDQAGIIGRQPGDLGLHAALGQAAAKPLDQPGAEGVELGHLRDVDGDVGPAAGELLDVGDDPLEIGRKRAVHDPPAHSSRRSPCAIRSNVGSPSRCQLPRDPPPIRGATRSARAALSNMSLNSHTWLRRASRRFRNCQIFK